MSFDRFSSNLAHVLLRSRSPSLEVFSFRGKTPWGQYGVNGHMLFYGRIFLWHISIERSVKITFCQWTTGQILTSVAAEVKKGHMLANGQKNAYFDKGVKVYQLLSRDYRLIHVVTCQFMS